MTLETRWPCLLMIFSLLTGGCAGFAATKETVTAQGVLPLIDPDSFEKIDLVLTLNPNSSVPTREQGSLEENRKALAAAFEAFYSNPTDQVQRRNRVQERLLAASNQRCGQYKTFLKQLEAENNLILGGLTTAAAAAGAIVTGVNAARALAGVAAIFSGWRAEFNEDFFHKLTIQVITDGFEAKRRGKYEAILTHRREDLTAYPVEAAVKDALEYHSDCSLISGLEQAALSIQRAENPGVDQATKMLLQARKMQAISTAPLSELFVPGVPTVISGPGLMLNLSGAPSATDTYGSLQVYYASRVRQVDDLTAGLKRRLTELKTDALKGQDTKSLETALDDAQDFTKKVFSTQLEKPAQEKDAAIQAAQAKIIGTTEPIESDGRRIELARQLEDGKTVASDIDKVFLTYQLGLAAAQKSLERKDQDSANRVGAAETAVRRVIAYAVGRRTDAAIRLLGQATVFNQAKLDEMGKALLPAGAAATSDAIKKAVQDHGEAVAKAVSKKAEFDKALDAFKKTIELFTDQKKEVLA